MLYDIGQVDTSGRVGSREIVAALGWRPRDRLELILTAGAIVLRACPDGLFSVPQRPRIIIPAAARHRHAIRPRDHVLLAAAPDYRIVIIYPLSALDDMIARYHLAHPAEEQPPHE
jgi:bifunctional DNA-binding transcriptional regulator/antitoxin component of YhaV-PrlF toxin-antitoxin module